MVGWLEKAALLSAARPVNQGAYQRQCRTSVRQGEKRSARPFSVVGDPVRHAGVTAVEVDASLVAPTLRRHVHTVALINI